MTLTKLIAQAQKLLRTHGDLNVLDNEFYKVDGIAVHKFKENIPEWNVTAGD